MWAVGRTFSASSLAAIGVLAASGLAGCSPSTHPMDGPAGDRPARVSDEEGGRSSRASGQPSKRAEATTERWVCRYDPTINRNWHDDVLCTRGAKSVRPDLRPNDDFITEDEMVSAARTYEKKLNKRR